MLAADIPEVLSVNCAKSSSVERTCDKEFCMLDHIHINVRSIRAYESNVVTPAHF